VLASPLGAQTTGDSSNSERDRPGSYLGAFFGGVSTTMSGWSSSDPRLAFSTGVQWDRVFESGAFLRSGVFYTGRGNANVIAQYVEFPLLLGYRLPDDVPTRVFGMAGVQLGMVTSCKHQYEGNGISAEGSCSGPLGIDFVESHETFDFGLVAGGGISISLGRAHLVLDFRVLQGLRAVDNLGDAKNRGFTIGAAYMVPIGHK